MNLAELREEVCEVNRALWETGLVAVHSGNASGLDPHSGHLVIKPSGIDYKQLSPEKLVEVDAATGQVVAGQLRPSIDLPHHLLLYQRMPDIRGIVHTHSNYATAFAACNRPIPLCLTAIADEFGAEIPCTPFAECDGTQLGESILKHRNQGPAILLANHGVFTWGPTPNAALKSALMVEDVAKTVFLSMQLGEPRLLPFESAARHHDRYQNRYGQKAA